VVHNKIINRYVTEHFVWFRHAQACTAVYYIHAFLGESQFRIIAKTDSGAEDLCIAVDGNPRNALVKKLCSSQDFQDASQLFKWRTNRDQLMHAASGLCFTGSTKRFGMVG